MASPPINGNFKFGAALTAVQSKLGYLLNIVESDPLLGTSNPTAPFLPNNADRVGLIIVNTSVNQCFVGLSQSQIVNLFGILLNQNGGSVTMQVNDDFTLPSHDWWGIAIGAPSQLYVVELIGIKALPPNTVPGVP